VGLLFEIWIVDASIETALPCFLGGVVFCFVCWHALVDWLGCVWFLCGVSCLCALPVWSLGSWSLFLCFVGGGWVGGWVGGVCDKL
jgi:hypothetical protein